MAILSVQMPGTGGPKLPSWKATERLYLNRGRDRLCREGDPESASLLCGVGAMVPEETCRRWGIGPFAPVRPAGTTVANTQAPGTPDGQDTGNGAEGPENGSMSDSEEMNRIEVAEVAAIPEGEAPPVERAPRRRLA